VSISSFLRREVVGKRLEKIPSLLEIRPGKRGGKKGDFSSSLWPNRGEGKRDPLPTPQDWSKSTREEEGDDNTHFINQRKRGKKKEKGKRTDTPAGSAMTRSKR